MLLSDPLGNFPNRPRSTLMTVRIDDNVCDLQSVGFRRFSVTKSPSIEEPAIPQNRIVYNKTCDRQELHLPKRLAGRHRWVVYRNRLMRAGTPIMTAPGGTSFVTTAPAPMIASSPIVSP